MTLPTEAELDRLEALERRATAGPWAADHDGNHREDEMHEYANVREMHYEDDEGGVYWTDPVGSANIAIAVELRNAAPALIAAARRALTSESDLKKAKAEGLREALRVIDSHATPPSSALREFKGLLVAAVKAKADEVER